ncbi:uracil-DNA glycosylase [Henriciella sp. AS95]|uniref:uracil-DNA glycosylase n=1 Tax=Henriciella sp. AS95 TaxID=3135782 RepID=UPI00317729DC
MTKANKLPAEAPADCDLCSRLVSYRSKNRLEHPGWFNGAVPSFGDENARLLIVGLAPGVSGANKTGRPFTGDWAGDLLYATINKFGFSSGEYAANPNDGLELKDAMITNAVRCVPPANKPVGSEVNTCREYLKARIAALKNLRIILCLGKISHDSTCRALDMKVKEHPFGHGTEYNAPNGLIVISSYHCSRYNTNTGRLTTEMFEDVFGRARELMEAVSA